MKIPFISSTRSGDDSGSMHAAAAAGIATLGLLGPTDDRLNGAWCPRCAVVRSRESLERASAQ